MLFEGDCYSFTLIVDLSIQIFFIRETNKSISWSKWSITDCYKIVNLDNRKGSDDYKYSEILKFSLLYGKIKVSSYMIYAFPTAYLITIEGKIILSIIECKFNDNSVQYNGFYENRNYIVQLWILQ